MSNLQNLNSRFQYKYDKDQYGRREYWNIMQEKNGPLVGDCEDYSLTLLWYLEGKSYWNFWKALFTRKAQIWFCLVNGNGHAILKYNGKWIDNGVKQWVDGFPQYDLKHRYVIPHIIWKLRWQLLSKIVRKGKL